MISPMVKVAAVLAIACALIGSLWLFNSSAAPAFGDVVDRVVRAESVSFTMRQRLGNQPVFVSKVYAAGDAMRIDMVGIEGPQEAMEKLRSEMRRLNLTAFMSTIADVTRKEAVQLDHLGKTYQKTVVDDQVAVQFTSTNVIQQFRNVKTADAKWLREESQGGHTIDIYLVTHVELMGIKGDLAGTEGERMTVQVDRKTGLPVAILVEASTDREGKSRDWFEFSGFTWNVSFDPGVLSLEIPQGYAPAAPITVPN